MFSCLQILEAFLWFVLITLLNVTLIILTLSVSRLLNLLLRLVAFLLFLNPQCLASISRWITASSSWKRFCLFVCRALSYRIKLLEEILSFRDRKSGSAGMPRPISYAVFCLKKKNIKIVCYYLSIITVFLILLPLLFFLLTPRPPISTLFPYTTLFRSISTLSQSPMLGFHKQMDNRIKLLEEILSFRMQGVELPHQALGRDSVFSRSEERFSRNAETDLVCRLLLEKKKYKNCLLLFIYYYCVPDLTTITFFLTDTAPTDIYTLSLHDALPIYFYSFSIPNAWLP